MAEEKTVSRDSLKLFDKMCDAYDAETGKAERDIEKILGNLRSEREALIEHGKKKLGMKHMAIVGLLPKMPTARGADGKLLIAEEEPVDGEDSPQTQGEGKPDGE